MRYRRAITKGGTFFFTLVTYHRRPLFDDAENIHLLRNVMREVKAAHPFTIEAFVLLPDHLHCIWTLPELDSNFSMRWRLIKAYFTRRCPKKYKYFSTIARKHKDEQCIWQRRFWEHQIRNEKDLIKHVEYIHYNPVKHGYVKTVSEWPYSSFFVFVKRKIYPKNWGSGMSFIESAGQE